MAGGLLNLVAVGSQNIILNGNPKTSFFKNAYKKYTNFGLQKFRIDYDGQRILRYKEETVLDFKIPRYAELLMDTYIVINLPNIWSPIIPPQDCSGTWMPYEFRWIENIGWHMIKEIEIYVGGQTLQKFSGEYMMNMMKRDFSGDKKELLAKMVGQSTELANPANFSTNNGYYPNAYYTPLQPGADPSIRGRKLYIPINSWFTLTSRLAFPLVCLQYNELHIRITLRPVKELFQIRDVDALVASGAEGGDFPNKFTPINPSTGKPVYMNSKYWGYPIQDIPLVAPDPNNPWHAFYRFLQPPPTASITPQDYENLGTTKLEWNADVHLLSTYCFLSNDETRLFAASPQQYLIKEVRERTIHRVVGSYKVEMDSLGLVSDWMFFFRRSDANLRNEWNNYTNWAYPVVPQGLVSLVPSFGFSPMLGFQSATHWGTIPGVGHVASMDPNNAEYTGNILLRDNFYDGLVNGGVLDSGDAADIIANPNPAAVPEQSPLGPLYDPAQNILRNHGMLAGPGSHDTGGFLPGINPNGSSPCTEAGKAGTPASNAWTGWSIGGVVPYPYAPIKITGNYTTTNQKGILLSMAILLDGKYRENLFDQGVYNYVEKYMRTFSSSLSDNLFCYNFCINASYLHPTTALLPAQPTGAINMSKFNTIEWEINTYVPPLNPQAQTSVVCDGSGNIIGINKTDWEIYEYTYDLHIMEARFNMVIFEAGNCGLQYAR